MTTQLAFHKTTFTPICHNNRIWLTATEVGLALEYADDKAVQRIYVYHLTVVARIVRQLH
ncbi:hypothetical protein ACY2TE_004017 [Escherichia coli]